MLKNLVRDWSAEGAAERAQSYGRILRELQARLGSTLAAGSARPRVLVPGAGLSRLCVDIAALVRILSARFDAISTCSRKAFWCFRVLNGMQGLDSDLVFMSCVLNGRTSL